MVIRREEVEDRNRTAAGTIDPNVKRLIVAGAIIGPSHIVSDITERKRAKEEIRAAKEQLLLIIL